MFVLEREPLKPVFRFDARDVAAAEFTPDSRSIVLLFDPTRSSQSGALGYRHTEAG